jgi:hypothetical protein
MAVSRVNLCLRPALKNTGGPDWRIPTSTGWARSTAMHATMPRTTGVAGTDAGNVLSAVAPVIVGRTYVGSVSVRAIDAGSGTVGLQWLDSTGVEISISATTPYSQVSGNTARLSTPVVTAPAQATHCRVLTTVVAGSRQLTAALVEQVAATGGTYFDGDDSGASWVDADGASLALLGTAGAALTLDVSYDDHLGRVRTLASGVPAIAARVRVLMRELTTTAYSAVRGGIVDLTGGAMPRSADDYEFPTDRSLVYRVEAIVDTAGIPLSTTGGTVPVVAVLDAQERLFTPPLARAWLKFVAAPALNRKITITDWSDIERPDRNAVYEVKGRPDPVIVTAGHGSRRFTLTVRTWDNAETEALDESLRQGIPTFLHTPDTLPLPSIYAVMGGYKWHRPSKRGRGASFDIPLIEVAPPASSIYGSGVTYATLLAGNATYAALLTPGNTYQLVAS